MKRPFEIMVLYVLLVLLAVSAFYGGLNLVFAPDGSSLKMDPTWLNNSPFRNYLIPGILLLFFIGISPMLAIGGMIFRSNFHGFERLNIYKNKYQGWTFSLYSGIIAVCWIISQQLLTGYFILQPVVAALGISIVIVTLIPRVSDYFTK